MFEQIFKNIDDVLWQEAGCTTELDSIAQTSWILFLKYLDDFERERASAVGRQGGCQYATDCRSLNARLCRP